MGVYDHAARMDDEPDRIAATRSVAIPLRVATRQIGRTHSPTASLRLDIIHEQTIPVAQVQLAPRDHGVRPGLLAAAVGAA